MRIHDHPAQHIERAIAATREERGRSNERGASPVAEDSLAITQSSVLLQALRDGQAGPHREAKLEALQTSYAAGEMQVDVRETSQLLVSRGFDRIGT